MEGITEIKMDWVACDNGAHANDPEKTWTNCIQYEQDGCFSTKDTGPPGTSGTVCDTVRIIVGCPIGLTDGFCLEADEMEAGDPLTSNMRFKKNFLDISDFNGKLNYGFEEVNNVSLTLHDDMPDGFNLNYIDDGYGVINWSVTSSIPGQTVDLGPAGLRVPLVVDANFTEDLTSCTNLRIVDLEISSGGSSGNFYVDPGRFCGDFATYDPNYQEAWITVDSDTGYCYGGSSMVLTADGPFNESSPNTSYSWNTDPVQTTQAITVNTPGTYTVMINDNHNCDRTASITIESCGEECQCGDLNPVISMQYVGECMMDFDVSIANCLNLETITYTWSLPDGSTYIGEDPPLIIYDAAAGATATVIVNYTLSGPSPSSYVCNESDSFNIYPCNTLDKSKTVVISPNPGKDIVTISIEDQRLNSGTIKIMDVLGNTVISSSFNMNTMRSFPCDVSALKTGLYFVQIQDTKTGIITTKRLLIE